MERLLLPDCLNRFYQKQTKTSVCLLDASYFPHMSSTPCFPCRPSLILALVNDRIDDRNADV
ncbi:Uncharacterized protein DAT39_018281 [Clarias magur]|uniref:Uncharacterized protein n=1 Tax=Clarias magur TaxID=1594786 RepID=A0A8J4X3K7_CLAMG|nr:Uncharacterized protein DAT39_018281 [Clarias magur]